MKDDVQFPVWDARAMPKPQPRALTGREYFEFVVGNWRRMTPQQREELRRRAEAQAPKVPFTIKP
jgi:hypothetical protein